MNLNFDVKVVLLSRVRMVNFATDFNFKAAALCLKRRVSRQNRIALPVQALLVHLRTPGCLY